jgi:hypothetical protein
MGGTLKIKVQPVITGPIADGTAIKACAEWAERVTGRLGDEAVDLLGKFPMDKTGRARGGFEENLHAVRKSPVRVDVRGPQVKGVAWSSWLEGTSSRNQSTKFKGYHLFRKTRAELDKRSPEIGQAVLDELMPELGGD